MRTSRQFAVSSRSYVPAHTGPQPPTTSPRAAEGSAPYGGRREIRNRPGRNTIRSEGRRLRSPTAFVSYASERIFMRPALGHGAELSGVIGSVDRGLCTILQAEFGE